MYFQEKTLSYIRVNTVLTYVIHTMIPKQARGRSHLEHQTLPEITIPKKLIKQLNLRWRVTASESAHLAQQLAVSQFSWPYHVHLGPCNQFSLTGCVCNVCLHVHWSHWRGCVWSRGPNASEICARSMIGWGLWEQDRVMRCYKDSY